MKIYPQTEMQQHTTKITMIKTKYKKILLMSQREEVKIYLQTGKQQKALQLGIAMHPMCPRLARRLLRIRKKNTTSIQQKYNKNTTKMQQNVSSFSMQAAQNWREKYNNKKTT